MWEEMIKTRKGESQGGGQTGHDGDSNPRNTPCIGDK
jgi:hypothetical protein